jgi:hypothetical protein
MFDCSRSSGRTKWGVVGLVSSLQSHLPYCLREFALPALKPRLFLQKTLPIFALALLGYGAGTIIGNFFVGRSDPSWTYYSIPTAPSKVIHIVTFLSSDSTDPTGDTLYIRAENGNFYSYTLFQSDWSLMATNPTGWKIFYVFRNCAIGWPWNNLFAFGQLKNAPPVNQHIVESVGEYYEMPPTTFARCYTLTDNGNLQDWMYSGNALQLLSNRSRKNSLMMIGAIAGIVLGVLLVAYQQSEAERLHPLLEPTTETSQGQGPVFNLHPRNQ